MHTILRVAGVALLGTLAGRATAQPPTAHPDWDQAYTRAIREATTDPSFFTELVDHLPVSATVPSPLAFFGHIAGAPDHLTYAADVARYMRALAAATPRVRVFSIGTTEEGREMIAVAVADERLLAGIDEIKAAHRRLADPRACPPEEAARLVASTPPVYLLTGALHSPETGSPEMLMELAYRLAVEDTELIRSIRTQVVTLMVPVAEVDGRERMVDLARWAQAHPEANVPPLVYWGHFVAHDNNRDGAGLALALTRNVLELVLAWRPQVMHDLHESIPFLYISGSTGPVSASLDPLLVAEWDRLAIHEVQELTARGVPGVWYHGFSDNWAPSYLDWVGTWRNAVGRFYETFGNHLPATEHRVVRGFSDRAWFRPNPPLPEVRWSLRNNVNLQQSGVLLALAHTAANHEHAMNLFWQLGVRAVAKARTEGPAAYAFAADQPRQGQLFDLARLLARQGVEVQVTERDLDIAPGWPPATPTPAPTAAPRSSAGKTHSAPPPSTATPTANKAAARRSAKSRGTQSAPGDTIHLPAGSLVVRMDQPLSRLADTLLDLQFVTTDEDVYDDTGWTAGLARNLESVRIANVKILDAPMHRFDPAAAAKPAALPAGGMLAVEHHADTDLVRLRTALSATPMTAAETAFTTASTSWPAGTVLIPLATADRPALATTLARLHLKTTILPGPPDVAVHSWALPRVALLHTWISTQDEGWYRLALTELGVPFAYISTQTVAADDALRSRFDVILFPPVGERSNDQIINGLPPGPPLPWRRTELTPNLGVDETDDMRPGLGQRGLANLARFVADGGVLITVGDTARLAVDTGLARFVSVVTLDKVKAPGTLINGSISDAGSPVAWGYDATVPVYFAGDEVFAVGSTARKQPPNDRPTGRGALDDPDVPQNRAFVAVPPEPTPGPGEEGFMPLENLARLRGVWQPRRDDRPRVILAADKDAKTLLASGMLGGADELAGKALVVDAPFGRGHVVLFAINPMWRGTTQGTWSLISNTILNAPRLGIGRPQPARP